MTTATAVVESGTHLTGEPYPNFDGKNPNIIPIPIPETLSGYADIQVENITVDHPRLLN